MSKPGKAIGWYLQNWIPGGIQHDIEFMADLLNEPVLKYQTWTRTATELVFAAKEFSLTITQSPNDCFRVKISSVKELTISVREYEISPAVILDLDAGATTDLDDTCYANISKLWELKQPAKPFDPYDL